MPEIRAQVRVANRSYWFIFERVRSEPKPHHSRFRGGLRHLGFDLPHDSPGHSIHSAISHGWNAFPYFRIYYVWRRALVGRTETSNWQLE